MDYYNCGDYSRQGLIWGNTATKNLQNFGKGTANKKLCMPGLHFDFPKLTISFSLKNNQIINKIFLLKSIIGTIGVVFSFCIFSEKTNESECTRAEYYYVLFGIKTCQK